jgi:hypothetical protein
MKLQERFYYLDDGRLKYVSGASDEQAEQGDEQAEQAEQGCSAGLEWAGFIGI